MDARKARRRWGLLTACASIVLGGWTGGAVRAESPVAGDSSATQMAVDGKQGLVVTTEGGLAHKVFAGMVAFNPPEVPPPPPTVPPAGPPPDVPPPPYSPETPVYPPDIPPDVIPPDIPPATGAPEPGGLLMGLLGSVCSGAAVWRRRLMGWVR